MTKKLITYLLIFLCLCTCLAPFNVIWAEEPSASIDISASSVDIGNEVEVTLRFSNTTATISRVQCNLTYNETVVEAVSQSGGGGNIRVDEIVATPANEYTVTYTFRALAEGSSTFTIENCQLWGENDTPIGTPTASKTLSVKDTSSLLSSNANLKSLTVSYGTLEPAFSPEITEYIVNVDNSVTKFPVSALPEDDKASASITENQNLIVGANTRVITVTAPDGTTKQYTITIVRAQAEATPTPTGTQNTDATPTPTRKPTPTQAQTQIHWGTPAQDITDAPDPTVSAEATPTPAETIVPPTSTSSNTGMSVNDLRNTMLTVIVIVAVIIIVVLFTIVYCMQQKDQKKRGKSKSRGSRK